MPNGTEHVPVRFSSLSQCCLVSGRSKTKNKTENKEIKSNSQSELLQFMFQDHSNLANKYNRKNLQTPDHYNHKRLFSIEVCNTPLGQDKESLST
ncbi:hypothetical protein SAMN05444359_11671 [Neolewinella agarilytica]|uniref:Uncharacterized protein n=1 Tax=Neolewinella agarilytica TaxID=478744 RepID=A0A1H9J370_9BACT|nr:hypothetical protein SAMN05444359_11671 [Neolewinella agarilytica]